MGADNKAGAQPNQPLADLLDQASRHHRSGDLARAAHMYRTLLERDPGNADALHLLGVLAHQCGDHPHAVQLIEQAIAKCPQQPKFHSNLGEVLRASGHLEAAVCAFGKALALDARFADAHGNLGATLLALGKDGEAIEHLEAAVRLNPDFLEAHMNLGLACRNAGRIQDAAACFEKVVQLNPLIPEAHVNLGNALKLLEKPDAASLHYQRAIDLQPQLREAHLNLALLHATQEHFDAARVTFQRTFELSHRDELWNAARFIPPRRTDVAPIRTTHFALEDKADHIEYLIARGKLDASFAQMADAYHGVLAEIATADDAQAITLTPAQSARIGAFFDKAIRFVDAPRITPPAVNPALDFRAIEDAYLQSPLAVTHLDDFLSPQALHALQEFCLESTIFFGQARGGFLSSYMGSGFQCSLLFQIAEELKQRLPRLLSDQSLGNMWVYRYPSQGEGVRAHTDEGSVTFNFWITPDTANLQPGRGGLVTYAKEQPLEWDFRSFNLHKDDPSTQQQIRDFLASADAVYTPYRCNRALLFHSNLFHRTDRFHFKDDYTSRRMNVTLLFGERGTDVRLRYR